MWRRTILAVMFLLSLTALTLSAPPASQSATAPTSGDGLTMPWPPRAFVGGPIDQRELQHLKQAAELNPEDLAAHLALGAAWMRIAEQNFVRGTADQSTDEIKAAKDQFQKIMLKWPEDKMAYAYLADIAVYEKDFAGGETALKALAGVEKYKDLPEPLLMLGDFYARFGKMDMAEAAYTEGLSRSGNSVAVRQKLAAFFTAERKFDKAIDLLKDLNDSASVQQLTQVLIADRKLLEAEELLSKMLAANPRDARALTALAFVQLLKGDSANSIDTSNEALQIDPRNKNALFYRGLARMRQGPDGLAEAIRDLTAARDLDPNDAAIGVAVADAYVQGGELQRACRELEAVVKRQPLNRDIRLRLIETYGRMIPPRWEDAERLLKEARQIPEFTRDSYWPGVEMSMWLARNQPDKALVSVKEAMALAAGDSVRLATLTRSYVQVLLRAKHYAEAIAACDDLLKNPDVAKDDWWVYQSRAIAYFHTDGGHAQAESDFDKALEISSHGNSDAGGVIDSIGDTMGVEAAIARLDKLAAGGNQHWNIIKAYLYLRKQDNAGAAATIEKVLASRRTLAKADLPLALSVAGSVYMLSGTYDKAEAIYREIVKLNPNDLPALNNLACLYSELLDPPQPELAVEFGRKALDQSKSLGATDPNVMDTYGWALIVDGQLEEGIKYLRAAIDAGGPPAVHYHLGIATLDQGRNTEARSELEIARKLLQAQKDAGQPMNSKMDKDIQDALERINQPKK